MTLLDSPAPPRAKPVPPVRWPLPPATRKAVLVAHIVSAGAWFGIDLLVCVLVLLGWAQTGLSGRTAVWEPFARWFLTPMLITAMSAGLVCLASGLILGWATKWGLLRYWWVAAKLALNVAMCTLLVVLLLSPFRDIATGRAPLDELTIVFGLSAVATALVTVASLLSVYKTWGRLRLPPPRRPSTEPAQQQHRTLLPKGAKRCGSSSPAPGWSD